ncbi:MAG TPA: hypothetical protein VM013_01155 [Dehalococcoidia bacterium]|nr:hypothetical protein [Dehalococcoidia bacterium]
MTRPVVVEGQLCSRCGKWTSRFWRDVDEAATPCEGVEVPPPRTGWEAMVYGRPADQCCPETVVVAMAEQAALDERRAVWLESAARLSEEIDEALRGEWLP